MNKIASRLKYLRELKGMSQNDLAKALNVTQSTIAKWETGAREPNADNIIKIAKIFNETTDFLLGANDY